MYTENSLNKRAKIIRTTLSNYKVGGIPGIESIRIWIRDTSMCTYCKEIINIKDFSVDHIIPLNRNGPNTMINIHLICKSCNSFKGDLTDEEFRWLIKSIGIRPEVYKRVRQRMKAGGFMWARH
jgi:CRISPR/Cas system Type II protein with McrA/HNH and RuvC-like nuclease domain